MQTARIIRIREYQELRVGDRFDASRSMIPRTALAMLRDIQSAHGRQKLFAISDRTVTMRQYVGTIGLGSFAIEVLPKIDRNDSRTRERLIDMLAVGRDANWASSGIARQSRRSMTLLDCLAVIYIRRLADQWRRGHIAHYTRRSENRRCLKGKLLVAENIRHNLLHRERFYTSHSEFIEDVPICQVLKAALRVCADRAWSQTVRSEARVLLPEMDEVSHWNPSAADLARIETDRRTERYAPVLELAKLLLQHSLADREGDHRTYSLLLDMNQVFESYICRLLQRLQTPTRRVQLQASGKSLLLQNGKKRFLLRPDAVVYESGQCETILDTKWKQLDPDTWNHGVKQSDIYQMYAYTREYNSRRTILLYPRSSIFKQAAGGPEDNSIIHLPLGIYHFPPNGDPEPALEIHAIDIACNNREVLRQLSQIINPV